MTELDRIDRRILSLMQNNARISFREIADDVDLAPSTCSQRIKRLRQEGILLDEHATVDPEALGIGLQALVGVRLSHHSRTSVDAFHRHALSLDEVRTVFHITGRQDFVLLVAVRDIDHLRDLTMDHLTTREEVAHIETSLVYVYDHKPVLPDLLQDDDETE